MRHVPLTELKPQNSGRMDSQTRLSDAWPIILHLIHAAAILQTLDPPQPHRHSTASEARPLFGTSQATRRFSLLQAVHLHKNPSHSIRRQLRNRFVYTVSMVQGLLKKPVSLDKQRTLNLLPPSCRLFPSSIQPNLDNPVGHL